MLDRRQLLKAAAGAVAGLASITRSSPAAEVRRQNGVTRLGDRVSLVNAGTNVLSLSSGDGVVLVDSGAPDYGEQLMALLAETGRVQTVFNTHWHLENTGSNEALGLAGANILAHENARLWMSTPYWIPADLRYEDARPAAAHPTDTFYTDGSLSVDGERIDYGYLIEAHTSADIYVFLRDSNVLAVGDIVAPVRDPELDYFTGAWIGGRVDAMNRLLELSNEDTQIVPGYGPVIGRQELQVERDMMSTIYDRTVDLVRQGDSAENMLEAGVMEGLARRWNAPGRFLDDLYKGLWAHHNKLAPNVV